MYFLHTDAAQNTPSREVVGPLENGSHDWNGPSGNGSRLPGNKAWFSGRFPMFRPKPQPQRLCGDTAQESRIIQ